MNTIVITQGDTAPGLIIVPFDKYASGYGSGVGLNVTLNNSGTFPSTTPSVTGHLDLSATSTSVLCKMRLVSDTTNIFSTYAQKIGDGSDGGVYLAWPFYATDVDEDNYEIEVNICWGARNQTAIDIIPIYIRSQFPYGGLIADDENVLWRGGKLYVRNLDTGSVHGVSISGDTIPTIEVDDGVDASSVSTTVTTVTVRVIDGKLVLFNPDDSSWRELNLRGPIVHFEVGDKIQTVNAGGTDDIRIATSRGRLLLKNLDTLKWHEVSIIGTSAYTIQVGGAEDLT